MNRAATRVLVQYLRKLAAEPALLGLSDRELLARFAQERKPDADAIADLAAENFVEMRDKVADPTFLKMRAIEAELQKRMPGRYLTRYQLVTFTRVPYRIALQAGRVQAEILADLARTEPFDYQRGIHLADERLAFLLDSSFQLGAHVP